jgi:hypothetical protein
MSTIGTGVDLQTYILIGTNTFPYDEMMQVILCVQGAWHVIFNNISGILWRH